MRRGLPMMLWAVVWTIVVAVATVSVWSAISRAGAHVNNAAAPRLPTNNTVIAPSAPPSTSRPTPGPTSRPSSQPSTRASARPTSRPTSSDKSTGRPAPDAVQRTWSGQAGRVTATCRAQQIKLDAAVPSDGFTVEAGNRGPETLEIEFHQNSGEHETQVKGACRADGPRFSVEEE